MDCSPEYVEDYEKCDGEPVIVCHSFKDGGLFNKREKAKSEVEAKLMDITEDEKCARVVNEKVVLLESNKKAPFQFVFGKYGTRKPKIKSPDDKERDLIRKQRNQQKIISKMEKELKLLKHTQEKQRLCLLDRIDATNKAFEDKTYELVGLHTEIEETDLVNAAKDVAIDQMRDDNEQYKIDLFISSLNMIGDLKVQIRVLGDELKSIEEKLDQRWRVFGKATLLKRFEKKGVLRMELERVVEKLDAGFDTMENC